jgi:omega-6 fatty acid desaturase (delta-12 desaturase)
MDQHANNAHTTSDSRPLAHALSRYREPDCRRSVFEVVITAGPFALTWVLIWAGLDAGYWICLLLAVPAAGFLVRLFMIQHDCGHGSFFRQSRVCLPVVHDLKFLLVLLIDPREPTALNTGD